MTAKNMEGVTSPHLMTGAQAARVLGVDRQTVRHWVDSGILPGERTPGGRLRVIAREVRAFAKERELLAGTLSPGQAAKELGVALNTVQRWVAEGKVPARRDRTGRWHIAPEDVEALRDRA